MTKRDNLLSLFRRTGYREAPVSFSLCPHLEQCYREKTGSEQPCDVYFGFPWRSAPGLRARRADDAVCRSWYSFQLKPGVTFDQFGVAHEPGSAAAMHMTRMRHPLAGIDSLERMKEYPLPVFEEPNDNNMADAVAAIHASGFASIGHMACTIWETAWYLRSMEDLMADMMDDDPRAEWLLDQITIRSCQRAAAFARSGADILALGDDIGMQHSIMMSLPFYRTWLMPRLAQVIRAARSIKPDMLVMYHSCGYIEPFIPDLIEAGVDILDPVQPECMDFKRLHDLYGAQLSFHGTIGTQTTMPFGTPDDVRRAVFRNLDIAGPKGGLMCAPTHLLEPEVPWANIMAYVDACRDYMR